ncbi:DapH/DapD/GlmU-related protein [Luminiphilus sp. nBUS_07]|uniref:DapH/DapD/GlmU-related protein n=1 Tax=Luminiphilus sp. nBUS_07 TaxID=3395314 RepID=UPI003EB85899
MRTRRSLKRIASLFINLFRSYFWWPLSLGIQGRPPIYIRGAECISFGSNVSSGPGLRVEAITNYRKFQYNPRIVIGDNVSFNFNVHIGAVSLVEVGEGCLIGSNVVIVDHDHGSLSNGLTLYKDQSLTCKGGVKIGRNVWIGEGVAILSGVTVGDNCIIGANSVLSKSVGSNSLVVGVPANVVRTVE